MSKYIIIDFEGTAGLAERQEDGTYAPVRLTEKAALVALLTEFANNGSLVASEPAERTLDQRQADLEALGYVFDSGDTAEDIYSHRDVWFEDDYVLCGYYSRTEALEEVEEHNNGRI